MKFNLLKALIFRSHLNDKVQTHLGTKERTGWLLTLKKPRNNLGVGESGVELIGEA